MCMCERKRERERESDSERETEEVEHSEIKVFRPPAGAEETMQDSEKFYILVVVLQTEGYLSYPMSNGINNERKINAQTPFAPFGLEMVIIQCSSVTVTAQGCERNGIE